MRGRLDDVIEKTCKQCGEPFTALHSQTLYCEDRCRRLAQGKPVDSVYETEAKMWARIMIVCPLCPEGTLAGPRVKLQEHLWRDHGVRA